MSVVNPPDCPNQNEQTRLKQAVMCSLRIARSARNYIGVKMESVCRGYRVSFRGSAVLRPSRLLGLVLASAGLLAWGKDVPLTAIEIYNGPAGAAYVQLNGVLINNKAEMRECDECKTAPIDKSAYNKLAKFTLGPGGTLERGGDGILRYTDASGATRIVIRMRRTSASGESASSVVSVFVSGEGINSFFCGTPGSTYWF